MSTTFGVRIPSTGEIVEVARRVGIGNGKVKLTWTNELGEFLPNDTEVMAMDNGQQGINTAGDIHFQIRKQNEMSMLDDIDEVREARKELRYADVLGKIFGW